MQSARDQFPRTGWKTIYIRGAWHPLHSTTGKKIPDPTGRDGWTFTTNEATNVEVERLVKAGYTFVSLEAASSKSVPIVIPISNLSY